jgi:hypothetical protein
VSLEKKSQQAMEAENLRIYGAYRSSPYLSIKHTSYFHVYERLLSPYVGRSITFVEVGVYNGGSLFMWRDFFGQDARIIGIDLNPLARRWEKDGFEIWIGNQASPTFWKDFCETVGPIDICLDDGGHSNIQQIQTTSSVIPYIKDGGLMIVEDTHCSYMTQFGNPSRHSFMSYAFDVVDAINSRFPGIKKSTNPMNEHVSSVSFQESIVAFHVNRKDCFISEPTSNDGESLDAADYRHHETRGGKIGKLRDSTAKRFAAKPETSVLRRVGTRLFSRILFFQNRIEGRRARTFFGS